MRLFLF